MQLKTRISKSRIMAFAAEAALITLLITMVLFGTALGGLMLYLARWATGV